MGEPGTTAGAGGPGGLGPAAGAGVAGGPTAGTCPCGLGIPLWTSGPHGGQDTGTWLCLPGSSLCIIGTDFLEHQIHPI